MQMTPREMRAARLHDTGEPMRIETVPLPAIRPTEVLVKVVACGLVQNLQNVLKSWEEVAPELPLPELPAIFGLDATGIVESVGAQVYDFKPGDRVYVNPGRSCGSCRACQAGEPISCDSFVLNGYFGLGKNGAQMFKDYPYGGLCEYMPAPQYSLVRLPDDVDFDTATRLGYLGTAFRGLIRANAGPGKILLINGITGTLGLGAVALALALGVKKILGTARNEKLFQRVKDMAAPGRIEILVSGSESVKEWSQTVTDGEGVDIVLDALAPGTPAGPLIDSFKSLNRGGRLVDIGAVQGDVPLDLFWALSNDVTIIGSSWFTTQQCQTMVDMAGAGLLELGFYEHRAYPLEQVNEAVEDTGSRCGGFTNYVIRM
jgi:D-arabinose 1-dehydrogenase-like Zn-dependent alcohol dehydrogenase